MTSIFLYYRQKKRKILTLSIHNPSLRLSQSEDHCTRVQTLARCKKLKLRIFFIFLLQYTLYDKAKKYIELLTKAVSIQNLKMLLHNLRIGLLNKGAILIVFFLFINRHPTDSKNRLIFRRCNLLYNSLQSMDYTCKMIH